MEKTIELGVFIKKLGTITPQLTNSDEFKDILVKGMELLDLADEDCARLFDVSRPTVTRWRNGSTAPHHAMHRLLFDVLKKEAMKRLRQRQRRESRAFVQASASSL
jgi:predicted transcriptional regulator